MALIKFRNQSADEILGEFNTVGDIRTHYSLVPNALVTVGGVVSPDNTVLTDGDRVTSATPKAAG